MDILYALKHQRRELYASGHDQIEYHQSQFRGDSKLFIVETDREKLKYFWEVAAFGSEALVSVYYDTNAPELHLQLLPMIVAAVRIDEALKGLSTAPSKQLSKMLSRDTFKDDRVLGKMDSLRQEESSPTKSQGANVTSESREDASSYLPPM